MTKPFAISKQQVVQAYKLVKANAGSAGVDKQSLSAFEKDLKNNLYKLWNRLSSGSYFPPPVRGVAIPKKQGGVRLLGVPTVADRICQMVIKLNFEPAVEPYFLEDSYGYRPNKSALEAVGVTRERCFRYAWVLEFDIKGLFDHIPHDLLMKAVSKHTECKWIKLHIERWLTVPMQMPDGTLKARTEGVPQGGVISPVLSNLFLHYVFDKWVQLHYPTMPWCRYADDGLVHCRTKEEAQKMLSFLEKRFSDCGLSLHPEKTKIIYCKNSMRKGRDINMSFDFLGYTFRPRRLRNKRTKSFFVGFTPAVSKVSKKSMCNKTRGYKWHLKSYLSLEEIAQAYNPVLHGWINYYGKYCASELDDVWRHFNGVLVKWAMRKHKRLRSRKTKAVLYLARRSKENPMLFAHWKLGTGTAFA